MLNKEILLLNGQKDEPGILEARIGANIDATGILGFADKNQNHFSVNSADEPYTEIYQGEFPFIFRYSNRVPVWFRAVKNCTLSLTEPSTSVSTRAGEIGVSGAYIIPINPKKRSIVAFSYYPKVTLVLRPTFDEDDNPMYPLYLDITVEEGAEKIFPISVTGMISWGDDNNMQEKKIDLSIDWVIGEYKKSIAFGTEFPSNGNLAIWHELKATGDSFYLEDNLSEVPQSIYVKQD